MPSLSGDTGSHYACTSMAGKDEAHGFAELMAVAVAFAQWHTAFQGSGDQTISRQACLLHLQA